MRIGYDVLIGEIRYRGSFGSSPGKLQTVKTETCTLELHSDADSATGVCKRRLEIASACGEPQTIRYAHITYTLDYPTAHLRYFTSDWGSEYTPAELDVTYPVRIGTWSGRSAKGCSPYFQVNSLQEDHEMLGISVGWSGNWEATVQRLSTENFVSVGLLKDDFYRTLGPGERFENIEIYDCARVSEDPEDLAFSFRSYFRDHISLMKDVFQDLPVCYNHWWPYEDKWINEEVFYRDAKAAKELGCTNTLLDAGWFGPPGDPKDGAPGWYDKQGDWELTNTRLFPSGLEQLGMRINTDVGIPFGIWCEIEAVGEKSHLRQTHPELIARKDGKLLNYVCFGNPKTREWALDIFRMLIQEYGARWIKIDFNLDPVSCDCQEHGHGTGDGLYEHYRGLYDFMDTVRRWYPQVVLENCSSGGLRIDYGVMQHCHLAFLSDPDYTPHHLKCFWGILSHIHPCGCYHFTKSETVCSHNRTLDKDGQIFPEYKPITNDTPVSSLDYMVRACMMSSFGLSQKLSRLPEWALVRIREHIEIFKEISGDYLYDSDCYRLTGQTAALPKPEDNWTAFQFTADKASSLVFVFKMGLGKQAQHFPLKGLNPDTLYKVTAYEGGEPIYGNGGELMRKGILAFSDAKEWSEIYRVETQDFRME